MNHAILYISLPSLHHYDRGPTVKKVLQVKKSATEIFAKATFTLHKWSSNARELELTETTDSKVGLT